MDNFELIKQASRIKDSAITEGKGVGAYAQAVELLKNYAGPQNAFLERLESVEERKKNKDAFIGTLTASIMEAFIEYVKNGLMGNAVKKELKPVNQRTVIPAAVPERDTEEKLLDKAKAAVNDSKSAPLIPVLFAGTALEFFLKKLIKNNKVDISGYPSTIVVCGRALMKSKVITQEDMKNITYWSIAFEDAEMGAVEKVNDMEKANIMLIAIREFISKYEHKVKNFTSVI
ncbi:MAG: hypothetical protein JXR81_00965 [Candidatus Goldbacteria bacterium]|nr:hypothetical protein [Candidatus Goldiibacteriota bacterium]